MTLFCCKFKGLNVIECHMGDKAPPNKNYQIQQNIKVTVHNIKITIK